MKSLLTLVLVVLYCSSFGQIRTFLDGKKDKDKIEQAKNATTFFLLPSYYEKEQYQSILEEYWTYSKFEVISPEKCEYKGGLPDHSRFKNLNEPINFIQLTGYKKQEHFRFSTLLELYHHQKNRSSDFIMAQFFLYDNSKVASGPLSTHNFSLGLFQNYIQKLNSLLESKQRYNKLVDYTGELAELRKNTLYIPQYHLDQMEMTEQEFKTKVFTDYPFKTAVISQKELDEKILNKEKCYYFIWNRKGNGTYFWVANSLTGDIIYSGYGGGGVKTEKNVDKLTKKHLKKFTNKLN